jgi:hypothetical protein
MYVCNSVKSDDLFYGIRSGEVEVEGWEGIQLGDLLQDDVLEWNRKWFVCSFLLTG